MVREIMTETASHIIPVRYWGRKAGESLKIVDRLIRREKLSGSVALDPFAGAGSLARSLLMRGLRVVATDLNLYAWLITRVSLGPVVEPHGLTDLLESLRLNVVLRDGRRGRVPWRNILKVECPRGPEPLRYRLCSRSRGRCVGVSVSGCRAEVELEDEDVLEVIDPYPDIPLYYPWGTPFDKRRTVDRVDQLYSAAMLAAMAALARLARRWSLWGSVGSLVWLALAAVAYPASRMQRYSGGSWPVNSYWLPDEWLERNPILLLTRRARLIARYSLGVRLCTRPSSLRSLRWGRREACVLWMSAQSLGKAAPRGFFDLLVTDPPHYDEIQYYELSLLHVAWLTLGLKRRDAERALRAYEEEIVVNPRRGIGEKKYLQALREAFESIHGTLKPGAIVVVILHEEQLERLRGMMDAIESAGFRFHDLLEATTPIKPAGRVSRSERRNRLVVAVGRRSL